MGKVMKQALTLAVLFIVIGVFYGCDDSNSDGSGNLIGPKPDNSSPMPLSIGNTWTYERGVRNSIQESTVYDTVSVRIVGTEYGSGGRWYVVRGAMGEQYWQNRNDGVWARRGNSQPFLLFQYPALHDGEAWPGPNGQSEFNMPPGTSCYTDVPGKGSFFACFYIEDFSDSTLGFNSFDFAAGLGITSFHISRVDPDVGAMFVPLMMNLIDYSIDDPPVDTCGTIAFNYHIIEPTLPGADRYRTWVRLDVNTGGFTWYEFATSWGPYLPVGGCCAISAERVPDSMRYTYHVELLHVPRGIRSMQITTTYNSGFDTLSSIQLNDIPVKERWTTQLETIQAFPY